MIHPSKPYPIMLLFFFQAEDGIRDRNVTGVQTCALPFYIHYLYIISEDHTLKGALSIRELLSADSDEQITNIMVTDVTSLPMNVDQEKAATIFQNTDLVSIPVVNQTCQLIGVVHVEDIL